MTSTPTTPTESFGFDPDETTYVELVEPSCPNCGSTAVTKDGTYTRNPHGRAPVRVQRYDCSRCPKTFSASLPSVEDGHRYADAVPELVRTVDAFASVTLYRLQDICIVQFGVCPSVQRIHDWIVDQTDSAEIVENDLPQYSGVYTYDEQYWRIDGERVYRLTLYDDLMNAPVGEQIAGRLTKDTVREFLTALLDDKPAYVITTDGRVEYADIVEDDVDAFHHRCSFHFLRNGGITLSNKVIQSVRYSDSEKFHAAIVWSEFKSVFSASSYVAALRRFEAVLDKVEHLPPAVRDYVEEMMENFDKFAVHLRDEWVANTTNDCERYYSHTKPTHRGRRFRTKEHAHAFLKTQMIVRTVKDGLVSRETSLALARELFPEIELDAVTSLFTETKQRYLYSRDLEAG